MEYWYKLLSIKNYDIFQDKPEYIIIGGLEVNQEKIWKAKLLLKNDILFKSIERIILLKYQNYVFNILTKK